MALNNHRGVLRLLSLRIPRRAVQSVSRSQPRAEFFAELDDAAESPDRYNSFSSARLCGAEHQDCLGFWHTNPAAIAAAVPDIQDWRAAGRHRPVGFRRFS